MQKLADHQDGSGYPVQLLLPAVLFLARAERGDSGRVGGGREDVDPLRGWLGFGNPKTIGLPCLPNMDQFGVFFATPLKKLFGLDVLQRWQIAIAIQSASQGVVAIQQDLIWV